MIDPAALARADRYRLLINGVVPRPIAWITTRNAAGVVNLAPFSFFNGVTAHPPVLSVAIAHRDPPKDTWRNLEATGEAIVHLVPPDRLPAAHESGADYPPEHSEAEALGLELLPAARVAVPRLACADVAFECRLMQAIPVGDPPTRLCLLEVVAAHVAAAVAASDGLPDPHRLRAAARLGGSSYLSGEGWTLIDLARRKAPVC